MTLQDLLDPVLDASWKGYPHNAAPLRRSAIAAQGWNVLRGDLPLPLAVIRRDALAGNLKWMQGFAADHGVGLAPHGKTTMSPQLFRRQLDAGAWGLTFATVTQLRAGVLAGARRAIIANQVFRDVDLEGLAQLKASNAGLEVAFLVDSIAQLELIEAWHRAHAGTPAFDVLLEIGVAGGRTGCRTHEDALALAKRIRASEATRLAGIECYEGLGATGQTGPDTDYAQCLMQRVRAIARDCDAQQLFEGEEVLLTAGGSAIFDLVATRLRPALSRPVRGLLRSGCYVTHDHGFYKRMVSVVNQRCGCADGEGLRPAMEVWAAVQSRPEPGLGIVAVGKRDISFDLDLPIPFARAARGSLQPQAVPASWKITGLNDQHAYLRWDAADEAAAPVVGERIGLGISHPCTTFDKWHWLPVVESDYRVSGAVSTHF